MVPWWKWHLSNCQSWADTRRILQELPIAEYEQRLSAAVAGMRAAHLDFLLVYGDREHFANLAFLTGFDPRFEEAVLLLDLSGRRWLLVGNECMGYLPDAAWLNCQPVLFQDFSLMGQPRGDSRSLRTIFTDFGIGSGASVGCAGWKYFEGPLVGDAPHAIEIPAYIVDLLREMVGQREKVMNAGAIFMNPQDGLRLINSASQIAQFEFASIRTSESVLSVVRNLREGVAENELEKLLNGAGLPLSCHSQCEFWREGEAGSLQPFGKTGAYRGRLRGGLRYPGSTDLPGGCTVGAETCRTFPLNCENSILDWP